jgi:H+/Cl- antiporter ClcA
MSPADWAGLIVAVMTIATGVLAAVRWLVKHYLNELKPNGGSSIKDKVERLDEKVEFLTDLVKQVLSR